MTTRISRCSKTSYEQAMNKKSQYRSRSNDVQRKSTGRRNHILEEIQKNNMKKQVQKKLEKENRQVWKDDGVIYIKERIHVPNN